ncbi:MAG: AMP-dependent synthetase and ligase [Promethearchaeota archaeon CR_4]|nr:MAG: AMP-dependent synthetase and ligase [Candidatus Lokiarchaeota archaeon CR_4]
MNAFISAGCCIALNPNFRDQKAFFEVVKATQPEWLPGVPMIYKRLLERDDFKDYVKYFKCVKICNSGASAMPVQVMQEFERLTGANIREGYGMTETSPSTISTPVQGLRKIGSIGVPVPNTEIKIVDVNDPTKIVPQGQAGELIVKGPQVMKGYWNKPKETLEQLKDGWLMTGDIVKMDEDGYIFIVDRKKEMINVSGEKVFAAEVENALLQFEPIANAAVIGVPHPTEKGNEQVMAFVILKEGYRENEETLAEIKDFCRKNLAHFKVPKVIEFKKEFPETVIGKIKKIDLKDYEKRNRGEEV